MSGVLPFTSKPIRMLVIEQLNATQWHVVARGAAVPAGSWERQATGVAPFETTVADALCKADLTGLPVFVEAYCDGLRPLWTVISPAAIYRLRRRSTLDEIMSGRGAA